MKGRFILEEAAASTQVPEQGGPWGNTCPRSGSSAHRPWAVVGGGSPAGTWACCDRKWTLGTRHIQDLCRFSSLQGTSGLGPDKRHPISSSLWGSAEYLGEQESLSSQPSCSLSLSAPDSIPELHNLPKLLTYPPTQLPIHLLIHLPTQTSSTYPAHHLSTSPSTHPPTYHLTQYPFLHLPNPSSAYSPIYPPSTYVTI